MEDVLVEQEKVQLMEQTTFISIEIHEHMQHVPKTLNLTEYMIVQKCTQSIVYGTTIVPYNTLPKEGGNGHTKTIEDV